MTDSTTAVGTVAARQARSVTDPAGAGGAARDRIEDLPALGLRTPSSVRLGHLALPS